jgi:hypothetical protein
MNSDAIERTLMRAMRQSTGVLSLLVSVVLLVVIALSIERTREMTMLAKSMVSNVSDLVNSQLLCYKLEMSSLTTRKTFTSQDTQ